MPRLHLPFTRRSRYRRTRHLNARMALVVAFGIVCCFLVAPLYAVYKPPNILIRYFQHRWPDVLWHVPTSKRMVALTIDDAPSEYTQEIRQTLKAYNATATFFVIGSQVAGREDVLQDLIRDGHELGNHAMHDEPSRSLKDAELTTQIETVQTKLAAAYAAVDIKQPRSRFFRPGSGFFSDRMRALMVEMGYRLVLGSIYPHDPQIHFWRVNARHILSMARPGGIIICHDRRSWIVPMLQKVLPELQRRGYRVVTMSQLLAEAKT